MRIGLPNVDLPGADDAQCVEWSLEAESSSENAEAPLAISMQEDVETATLTAEEHEVLAHLSKYRSRVEQSSNSNTVSHGLAIGDEVLLKCDFDNNPTTRRYPFRSFFGQDTFTVTNIPPNTVRDIILRPPIFWHFSHNYKSQQVAIKLFYIQSKCTYSDIFSSQSKIYFYY